MNILGSMYEIYKTLEIVKMKNLFEFKGRLHGGTHQPLNHPSTEIYFKKEFQSVYGEDVDLNLPTLHNQSTLAEIFKGFFYRITRRKIQSDKGVYIDNTTLADNNDTLNLFVSATGSLYLEQYKQKGVEPYQLTLYSQNQKYMVMFAYSNVGEDDEIRTFYDPTRPDNMVNMLGNFWDNRMIVDDFSLVRRAFTEFYLTGDIDREIVS